MAATNYMIESVGDLLSYPDSRDRSGEGSPYHGHGPIKYNATDNKPITSYGDEKWLEPLVRALNKCGIECQNTGSYDFQMEQAILNFQNKYMSDKFWYLPSVDENGQKVSPATHGLLDDRTVEQIFYKAREMSDIIEDDSTTGDATPYSDVINTSPHYTSFFDEDNSKQFRQNHKNIKIVFGNSGIVKELHDVVMRSVGVEVDTSGNPISETYEFIARDVTESDEKNDIDNYTVDNGMSPSDIKYIFNFN